jgi:hypothetical protein
VKIETKTKIGEQRGFLQRSVEAFNDGHGEEALRIATTIRVLVHETGHSRPLLKSVRPDYLEFPILDFPVSDPPGGDKVLVRYGIGVKISGKDGVQPITDTSRMELTSIGKWWEKSCLVFTDPDGERIEFRRRDLLLTLANKEGGAHLDTSLPPKYERYVVNSGVTMFVGAKTDTIHLARFAAVEAAVQMMDCLDRILA